MLFQPQKVMAILLGVWVFIIILAICCTPVEAIAILAQNETIKSAEEEFTNTQLVAKTTSADVSISISDKVRNHKKYLLKERIIIHNENMPDDRGFIIPLNDKEKYMLASIIYHEGGIESYETQLAIGSVVLNRIRSGLWGDSISDVLFARGQFVDEAELNRTKPTETQIQVVEDLLENGTTIPYYVMYFRIWHYFDWATDYALMDHTYFSYLEKDK